MATLVGTGGLALGGLGSDTVSVTPSDDLAPILTDIADQTYTQGALVDFTLPEATGGDGNGYT